MNETTNTKNTNKGVGMTYTNTITIKKSAVELLPDPIEIICEHLEDSYSDDDIVDTYNNLFANATFKKFGRGGNYTFTITSSFQFEVIEELVSVSGGYIEAQNMFGEDNADKRMEDYLNDISKYLRTISVMYKKGE